MLSQAEKNYREIKVLELLALAEACNKARYYISRASKVHLLCDNKNAIKNIKNYTDHIDERSLRFVHRIQQLVPSEKRDLQYSPTKQNAAADFLSRFPLITDHIFLTEKDREKFLENREKSFNNTKA